ncbi:uncharacterized protein LOC124166585 [Ischnura elegans]|uniref:uncharacterized protein LOC124166585 n=1 Tax=Ischnura elegans TaxID=197161 RepID=UPI001ED8BA9B|nr:uncharacterized protein LOC124166585 [Ischnura elegans]
MANQKKRFEFESTFGSSSRSPKRPKLEVIQRPSLSGSKNESFENMDENDELWGDELESDVMQEVILLESQAVPPNPPVVKCEPIPKPTVGVFKPKTATVSHKTQAIPEKETSHRDDFRDCGFGFKESKAHEKRPPNTHSNTAAVIKPLVVEKVKNNAVGKGCARSNSMPTFGGPGCSSAAPKPWSEIKDLSRNLLDNSTTRNVEPCDRPAENAEELKALQKEIERLRSEAFTKAGEAALLRQKIKDASMDLERERNYRATLLEKTNQKHQLELSALNRELEAAKTQLQFKELDVDKAIEKCKLLEAGNLKVRPMELKLHTALRSTNSSDFPSRSSFEKSTPKKRAHSDAESKGKQNAPKTPENEKNKVEVNETAVQTEDKFIAMQKSRPELFSRVSEGEILSQLIVPVWFEMDSGATEEQFENKWEGVSAVTELLKMTTFQGEPMEKLVEWCWQRMLAFLSTLRQKSEDDYKLHKVREESRRQYEEWCLDRRIPLPPQKQALDEGLIEDWFCDFSEESIKDELSCLLSFRPWCPREMFPEIRRTLALIVSLMRVSRRMASVFSSHNQKSENDCKNCYLCGSFIKTDCDTVDISAGQNREDGVSNEENLGGKVACFRQSSGEGSSRNSVGIMPTCSASKNVSDSEAEKDIMQEVKDFLKFDFLHVVQQICKVISGMREILPMEGTLAGILAFFSGLGEQTVLSRRALLLMSAVVKEVLFIRPHLRTLPLLMRLLSVTGEYPLILQKLCVNSAWNTAYRDKWSNIWMFSKGVCPLQVLITILGNVADERSPDGVTKETWCIFRAKIGLLFVQWLNAALTQPGHQVDWLCYVIGDDIEESEKKTVASNKRENCDSGPNKAASSTKGQKAQSDLSKISTSGEIPMEKEDVPEMRGKTDNQKNDGKDLGEEVPCKSLADLSISKLSGEESDEEKENVHEPSKRCCCRRWIVNILVNILYAILSDLQNITNPVHDLNVKESGQEILYNARKTIICNKRLEHEQSLCLRLGLFVLRALLRRDHPELNTPGGEGFMWNHYTVRGSVLINGQIVRKDYSHKNTPGGPIGGRYVLLLSQLEKQMKGKMLDFCPETEKALQELLEVENSVPPPAESEDEEENGENIWESMRNIGCSSDS